MILLSSYFTRGLMRSCLLTLFTTFIILTDWTMGSLHSAAASFDCQKTVQAAEKIICADAELNVIDTALGKRYSQIRATLAKAEADALRKEQLAWLRERNACATQSDPISCMKALYEQRLRALAGYLTLTPSEPVATTPPASKPAPEPTPPTLTKPEPTPPALTKPALTKPEPTEPALTKPEPTKPEPTKPAPTKSEPVATLRLSAEGLGVLNKNSAFDQATVSKALAGYTLESTPINQGDQLIQTLMARRQGKPAIRLYPDAAQQRIAKMVIFTSAIRGPNNLALGTDFDTVSGGQSHLFNCEAGLYELNGLVLCHFDQAPTLQYAFEPVNWQGPPGELPPRSALRGAKLVHWVWVAR